MKMSEDDRTSDKIRWRSSENVRRWLPSDKSIENPQKVNGITYVIRKAVINPKTA
ncbi:hypothetical protein [Mesobacillus subterraneus]|uniref:hypothetical protein n=1 Tax=Mesobacillus subterraneus TaxID=285983 RepID=UPI0014733EA7|nr:hypothetical protein [Mesobacillus subterraneus]